MHIRIFIILIAVLCIFTCISCNKGTTQENNIEYTSDTDDTIIDNSEFIHAEGSKLIINGEQIFLRGIGFSNYVWIDDPIAENLLYTNHHNEYDYKRVKEMGMNVVRFNLHYNMIEDGAFNKRDEGFEWLNQNIQWAKDNGVYLILNLHVLPGDENGEKNFWENQKNRNRVVQIWKNIAEEYKDETTIAGYDLINEPVVHNNKEEYTLLVDEIINEIRRIDSNHLIIVERLYGIGEDWVTWNNPDFNWFLVDDNNVMYDFHFYYPEQFTLQGTMECYPNDFGPYPSHNEIDLKGIIGPADKYFIQQVLDAWMRFGIDNKIPLNVGEFGVNAGVFYELIDDEKAIVMENIKRREEMGGIQWVSDIMELMIERDLNFQYHAYHEPTFGVFQGYQYGMYLDEKYLPTENFANTDLIDLFKDKLD